MRLRVQREGGEEKTNDTYLQLSFLLPPCICDNTLVRCTAAVPVVERLYNEQVEGLCSLSAGRTLGYSPFIYHRNFTIEELANASSAAVSVFTTACIIM